MRKLQRDCLWIMLFLIVFINALEAGGIVLLTMLKSSFCSAFVTIQLSPVSRDLFE